jgi:predicted MPP superfamily phosphohydrolase
MRRFWHFPILCAALAVLAVAVIDWSVVPLNEAGRHQWATGWLAGIARLLEFPGLLVGRKLRLHVGNRPALASWCIMMAGNVPLYLFGAVAARWLWTAGQRIQESTTELGTAREFECPPRRGKAAPVGIGPSTSPTPRRPGSRSATGIRGTTGIRGGAALDPLHSSEPSAPLCPGVEVLRSVETSPARSEMVRSADPTEFTAQRPLPTRRQFLVAGNRLALAGAAATLGYSFLDREQFIITRRTIPIRGLPPSLHGITIAQITDIHHGPWTSLAYVRRIVDTTNALNADLIALTGDYILYSPTYVRPVATELTGLRAKIGILGVLGNHDWSDAGPVTLSEFRRAGLRLIDNARMFISPDRQLCRTAPKQGLCVGGLADLWGGRPNFSRALGGVAHDMPRVLLSHNPDTAEMPVARDRRHRVDLMLSGHTHGGQINIPGIGSPFIPSAYGQKYAYDLVHGPAFRVFVSSGLGTNVIPLRFCRPPEIAVITLTGDKDVA